VAWLREVRVPLTGAGGGVLEVNRGTLRQVGEGLSELSEAIRALSAEVSSACSAAAPGCPGWQIAAASSAAASRWDRGVTAQASTVSAAAGRLIRSAANYSAVESGLVARAATIGIMLPGVPAAIR
jgi:hypothetical protein